MLIVDRRYLIEYEPISHKSLIYYDLFNETIK
jgi:hypothetical protein